MAVKIKQKGNDLTINIGGVACDVKDFFINYRGNRFGLELGAVQITGVEERASGSDILGEWTEQVLTVVQPAKFISEFRLVLRQYDKQDIVALHIENDLTAPMFDTDAVAGIEFDIAKPGPGYVTHLKMHEFDDVPPGYFFCTSTFSDLFPSYLRVHWGNFSLCEAGGRYLSMLPLVGAGMGSRLNIKDGRAGFVSTGFDCTAVYNRIPLGIIGSGRDPYQLVKALFRAAKEATGNAFNLREEKQLPDIFKYFGWCSWNAFYQTVNADGVVAMADSMRKNEVPVGYFLIDDGWQSVHERKMIAFDADPEKFPGGLAPLVDRLKSEYGIKHVGVWHTKQGYWAGIDPNSHDFSGNPHWFWFGTNKQHCPNPLDENGKQFMLEWYRRLRGWGVDFVKVDNQGDFRDYFYNLLPQAEAEGKTQANLQAAAEETGMPIINCMEQHPECYYHYTTSAVARSNTDFMPEGESHRTPEFTFDSARRHLQDSLYNSLWFQEIVYPDYDMFQTSHSAARCFAALNALSGGPLYTTDLPDKIDVELLRKLMNDDGTLLRADQPARPCIETLTSEPMRGQVPLAAFAPVAEGTVVVAMNIGAAQKALKASISVKGLQVPSAPKFAVYSHFAGKLATVTGSGSISASLDRMEVEVLSIVPIRQRFAAIGLVDRLISPAGIAAIEREDNEVSISLTSPGLFGAYVGRNIRAVTCGGEEASEARIKPRPGQFMQKGELLLINTPSTEIRISL